MAMRRVGATRVMARGRDHRGLIRDRGGVVPGECGVAGARAGSQVSGRAGPEPGLGPRERDSHYEVWVGERVTSRMAEEGVQKRGNLRVGGAMAQRSQRMKCKTGLKGW